MIKELLPKQVVCTEKGDKGKPCHGGLKRYHPFAEYYNEPDPELRAELKRELGEDPKLIVLKCELCKTVYKLPPVLAEKYG